MSFRLKTIVGIALVEGTLLLVLVLNSLNILRNASDEAISNYASTSSKLFATSIENAILSLDLATIEAFVQAALSNRDITYVRVKAQNTILAEGGESSALARPFTADSSMRSVNDGIFDTRANIDEGGVHYGSVELGISVARMSEFMQQARSETTILALTEMVLVAIFSLILGTYLTRQLLRLENASKTIAAGEVGLQITVHGSDELARTTMAFNHMSRKLKDLYDRIENDHARLHSIIETVHDGIITIDDRGTIESANGAAGRIFGYECDELVGNNINILIPPSYQHEHNGYIRKHVNGSSAHIMNRLRTVDGIRRNGETFPLEIVINEMFIDNSHKFVGALRDVSAAKEASKKLRKSEALKSSIYNAALDAIITIDSDGNILEFNKIAEQMFGYTREEVLGIDLTETIIPPRFRRAHTKGVLRYLQSVEPRLLGKRIEIEVITKGGKEIPVELWTTPISLEDNTIFTSFIRDISERKKNEEIIIRAKEQAEAASRAKSDFLAVMSHEIRTPINAILGSLSILEDSKMDLEQQRHLENARQGGESMLMVINDILDYSKIEAGKLTLYKSEFKLLNLLESVITMMAVKATEKDIELSLLLDPQLPRSFVGDAARLRQILLNLLSNAIKFTDEGGIILSVKLAEEKRLHFEVIDSGIGISEENQTRLFQQFEQVDSSYSRKSGGSGLGLAICLRLVEMMKGEIGVESKPSGGSRFWFNIQLTAAPTEHRGIKQLATPKHLIDRVVLCEPNAMTRMALQQQLTNWGIPVEICSHPTTSSWLTIEHNGEQQRFEFSPHHSAQQSNHFFRQKPLLYSSLLNIITGETEETESTPPINPSPQYNTINNKRLLLVEDVAANQLVASTMLKRAGYEVDIASNGREAINAVLQHSYDLILMDLSMPEMDGITATRHIFEQMAPDERPPILAMTANVTPDDRERCMTAGMQDFITKPIERQKLLETIATHLAPGTLADDSESEQHTGAHPPAQQTTNGLDMVILQRLEADMGEEMVPRAIEIYTKEAMQRLRQIAQAHKEDDFAVLRSEAHALKSSSGTMGVTLLQQLARELEQHCKDGNQDEAQSIAGQIYEAGVQCLDKLCSHYGLSPPD